jgi:regulator of sigma E protease
MMVDVLLTVLALAVALSLLVAVHELGHFLVARWCGVKVLRYSIGFGKPLWQRRFGADRTEFTIATIPLGGYVKMLDEREGEVAEAELHRAFNRQTVGKRSAIVVAGPLFNFLFAILAYWLMFMLGVSGIRPLLGDIEPGTVAYASGLRDGQEIVAVNDEKTPTWQAVIEAVMPQLMLGGDAELTVSEGGLSSKKTLSADRFDSGIRPEELVSQLGLKLYRPAIAPIIDKILPGSVAEQAGLRSGDRVAQAAGEATEEWEEVVKIISEHPGKPLLLQVVRDGRSFEIEVRPTPTATPQGTVGRIGASVQLDESLFESMQAVQQYPVGTALIAAWDKTWEISGLTLKMIGEMVLGRASVENLSGPIGIAQYAKSSAVAGLDQFLKFLGLISVSLGVLNLLPIPVLDGGHLLFFGIEAVRGRPVSEQTEALGQRIGLALILALMFLAVYNDLVRLAG